MNDVDRQWAETGAKAKWVGALILFLMIWGIAILLLWLHPAVVLG